MGTPLRAPARAGQSIEPVMREVEKLSIIIALRENPEWTLEDLDVSLSRGGPRAEALGRVTVRELVDADTGPPVRLVIAKGLTGPDFDAVVHQVLVEARRFVRAGYVRARVGGPAWKVQQSLGRLAEAGLATRRGTTSNTVYEARRRC